MDILFSQPVQRIVEHLAFQYDYLIEVPRDQATDDKVSSPNLDPTAHLINNKKIVDLILCQIRKDLPKSKLICNIFDLNQILIKYENTNLFILFNRSNKEDVEYGIFSEANAVAG